MIATRDWRTVSGGVLPPVDRRDIGIDKGTVALDRLRLQPGCKAPGPGRGADQPDRTRPSQQPLFQKGEIETACNQPPGASRRAEIGPDTVQTEAARPDEFIGQPARLDTDVVHTPFLPSWQTNRRILSGEAKLGCLVPPPQMALTGPQGSCRLTPSVGSADGGF